MTTSTTANELAAVLQRHGFAATDNDRIYRHTDEHDLLVVITDGEATHVNVAAREPDTSQRFGWEIDLHGAPAAVLDATLRAACTPPDVYTVVGVWINDTPVPVGTIHGRHEVTGDMPDDVLPGGCWATSVAAPDPDTAQQRAAADMRSDSDVA